MIDHVTIRVSDLAASRRFYQRSFELLGFLEPSEGGGYVEWNDFSISQAHAERPVTRRLHAGFVARSREQVDEWWAAMTAAGAPDDGAAGPRPQYSPDYYGGFVLDPDGNSVEAVHHGSPRDDGGVIDHLWLRVRDPDASGRFYEAIAPTVGLEVLPRPDRVHVRAGVGSFTVVAGDPTEHVHLAFAAADFETVQAFHAAGVAAGYRSNGAPGERPEYHPGYYGAYLLDPDGHNVEAVFHVRS